MSVIENLYFRRQCKVGNIPYVIRTGDTLEKIAKLYNTTVEAIISENEFVEPYNLKVGSLICVPPTVQYYPTCPTTNYYVVKEGDTFESIANYFNMTTNELYYSNYGINPNDLYTDQILCIPIVEPPVNIIINTLNQELYLYRDGKVVKTYKIYQKNDDDLKGEYVILNKQVDPGEKLGARWLGFSDAGVGIQGTNTPEFIEQLTSNKNFVMSNEDISEVFNLVTVGTTVVIL